MSDKPPKAKARVRKRSHGPIATLPRTASGAIEGVFEPFTREDISDLAAHVGLQVSPRADLARVLQALNYAADWFPVWRLAPGDPHRVRADFTQRIVLAAEELLASLGFDPANPHFGPTDQLTDVILRDHPTDDDEHLGWHGALAMGETEWKFRVEKMGKLSASKAALVRSVAGVAYIRRMALASSKRHRNAVSKSRRPRAVGRTPIIEGAALAFARLFHRPPRARNDDTCTEFQHFAVAVAKIVADRLPAKFLELDPDMATVLRTLTPYQAGAMLNLWRRRHRERRTKGGIVSPS